jgi:hypothetical protein
MGKRTNGGWSKRMNGKLDKAWMVIRKAEAYNTRRAASAQMKKMWVRYEPEVFIDENVQA